MSKIIVAGMDISLTNLALVKSTLDLKSGYLDEPKFKLITTAPSKDKTVVKRLDDVTRCRELYLGFQQYITGVDVLFVELPTGSQMYNGAKSYAVSCYTLATTDIPYILIDPKYLKQCTAGKGATKKEMIAWAREEFPDMNIPKAANRAEHVADALGAIYAGVTTNEFKLITSGIK